MPKHKSLLVLPEVLESTMVHDGFLKLRKDKLRHPKDGHIYDYYSLIPKCSAVVILAVTKQNTLVLIEEYRHPTGKTILSAPGGYLTDETEDPCIGAQRELLEETGYTAETFKLIGSAYPYPGISSQKIYYVLAQIAKKRSDLNLDPSEIILPLELSREDLQIAISKGQPIDGNLCTVLFFESFTKTI